MLLKNKIYASLVIVLFLVNLILVLNGAIFSYELGKKS